MPDTRTGHRVAGSIDALHDLADVLFARLSGRCDVVDAGTQPANEVKGAGTQYDEHAADAELQTEPARELADDSVDRWNSWKTLLLPSVVTRTTHRWILPPSTRMQNALRSCCKRVPTLSPSNGRFTSEFFRARAILSLMRGGGRWLQFLLQL